MNLQELCRDTSTDLPLEIEVVTRRLKQVEEDRAALFLFDRLVCEAIEGSVKDLFMKSRVGTYPCCPQCGEHMRPVIRKDHLEGVAISFILDIPLTSYMCFGCRRAYRQTKDGQLYTHCR